MKEPHEQETSVREKEDADAPQKKFSMLMMMKETRRETDERLRNTREDTRGKVLLC